MASYQRFSGQFEHILNLQKRMNVWTVFSPYRKPKGSLLHFLLQLSCLFVSSLMRQGSSEG